MAADSSGVLFNATNYERTLTSETVLLPLPTGYLEQVVFDLFLQIVDETDLDKVRDLLAFERAAEIEWSVIYKD